MVYILTVSNILCRKFRVHLHCVHLNCVQVKATHGTHSLTRELTAGLTLASAKEEHKVFNEKRLYLSQRI